VFIDGDKENIKLELQSDKIVDKKEMSVKKIIMSVKKKSNMTVKR